MKEEPLLQTMLQHTSSIRQRVCTNRYGLQQNMLGTFCLNSAELAVISCRKQHGLVARREGLSKTIVYGTDLFHTMLHVSKRC